MTTIRSSFYQLLGGQTGYQTAINEANSAKAAAEAARDLARKYAVNPEDETFLDGSISRLSAMHYAAKAAASAALALGGEGAVQDLTGVSITKFSDATPDGVTFWDDALEDAFDSGEPVIIIPKGIFRFGASHILPTERSIFGASKWGSVVVSEGDHFLVGERKEFYTSQLVDDWCKMTVANLRIKAQKGGFLFKGHEIYLEDLVFEQGLAGHWAIDFLDVNEFEVSRVTVGKGASVHEWNGSGLRMRLSRGTGGVGLGNFVNFGDGLVQSFVTKLKGANQIGILLDATGYDPVNGTNGATSSTKPVINNVKFSACHINSGNKPAGSIGMYLKQVARCAFVNHDVENLDTAWKLESAHGGGNSGSNQYNGFFGCYQLNCTNPWVEVGSAPLRNTFIGSSFTGPGGPYGYASGDTNGTYDAKRSGTDWIIPNGLIFSLPGNGLPKAQIRLSDNQHLYLVGDIDASPASGQARPGMPKQNTPVRALGFDATGVNAARIFRPEGWSSGSEQRIEIGNGAGFQVGSAVVGPLHRVQIHDPLYLTEWTTALPTSYGTNTPGLIVNVGDKASVMGSSVDETFQGVGPYSKLRDVFWNGTARANQTTWMPMFQKPGRMRTHLLRASSAYTLQRDWFGKISEISGSACDITVPVPDNGADVFLIRADEASEDTNRYASAWFMLRAGTGTVRLLPATGVTMYVSGEALAVAEYTPAVNSYVQCIYTRINNTTARLDIIPLGGTSGSGTPVIGDMDGGEI